MDTRSQITDVGICVENTGQGSLEFFLRGLEINRGFLPWVMADWYLPFGPRGLLMVTGLAAEGVVKVTEEGVELI